ncbi:hypothetical protein ACHAXA_009244 [Cyclostephanos tholiformis]|uniref:SGNH hydrolase-type esterase domain-containing protein n=1 Tax=Cyclostephanos tholiformis TaxID=382380 RepID=A0ABD3R9P4_9STRA
MQFDEMRRRQQAIVAANARGKRRSKKFSLLLPQITAPSPHYQRYHPHPHGGGGECIRNNRIRCAFAIIAPLLLMMSYHSGRTSQRGGSASVGVRTKSSSSSGVVGNEWADANDATARDEHWRTNDDKVWGGGGMGDTTSQLDGTARWGADVVEASTTATAVVEDSELIRGGGGGRPFEYTGDIDPTSPRAWPESEVDWWAMHDRLVERVRASDDSPTPLHVLDDVSSSSHLPQLIFYGDSITEGWEGTSLGHRTPRYDEIGNLFNVTFGDGSTWGKRALRSPLLLGIGGSRTYDLIWRIENGEFPRSRLLGKVGGGREGVVGRGRLEGGEKVEGGDNVTEVTGVKDDDEGVNGQVKRKGEGQAAEEEKTNRSRRGLISRMIGRKRDAPRPSRERRDDVVSSSSRTIMLERIYVVLIGTNNIGGGMLPYQTARGIDAVGRTILRLHNETHPPGPGEYDVPAAILLSELLPRKDDHRAIRMCPPRCANVTTSEPYKSFMPAIRKVNGALPEIVDGWRRDFPNSRVVLLSSSIDDARGRSNVTKENDDGDIGRRMGVVNEDGAIDESSSSPNSGDHYTQRVYCGREMFAFDDESEFDIYMPDRLHPNAKGYELWSRCLNKGLAAIVTDNSE